MVKFKLKNGNHTNILFFKPAEVETYPFPTDNANLVLTHGVKNSITLLNKMVGRKEDDLTPFEKKQFF